MNENIIHGIPDVLVVILCAAAFVSGPFIIGALTRLVEATWDGIAQLWRR